MLPESEIDNIAAQLSGVSAFQGMPNKVARRMALLMELRHFKTGEFLTSEGGANEGYLMLILSGQVKVSSTLQSQGQQVVHRMAVAGHIIGEVGFIDGKPHSANCEALEPTRVAYLLRSDFVQLFEADPVSASQLMAGLLRLLSRRVRAATKQIMALDQKIVALQAQIDPQEPHQPAP